MPTRSKSDVRGKIIVALIGLAGILVGTFGKTIYESLKPKDVSLSSVQQFDGIYIFIRSIPKIDYINMENISTNDLTRAIESGQGKKGWDILKNIGESMINDIPFEHRLSSICDEAKARHNDIQGLIFNNDLTECQIIKFK